jgi:hypothetical protein
LLELAQQLLLFLPSHGVGVGLEHGAHGPRATVSVWLWISCLSALSQQVGQLARGCEAATGEVRPGNPDLTPPCIATPMPV